MKPDFEKSASPFGLRAGLETDRGIVAMPEGVIHGYVWKGGYWVIAASAP